MATPEAPLREILKSISFTRLPLRHIEPFFVPEPITVPRLYIYGNNQTKGGPSGCVLPTYDIECLRALAVLRFAKYRFDVAHTAEPNASPDGKLPYLLLPDGTALRAAEIASHLEQSGHSLPDCPLVGELAYRTMVERSLAPAVEYMAWVDPVGFEAVGDARYLGGYPSLIRYLLGWIKSSRVAASVRCGLPEYGAALDGDVLTENALRALDSLLALLGDGDYLAGAPSLLDAHAAACLNVLLEAPLKCPLRSALLGPDSKYKPLADYALRLLDKHLST
ncbi:hypothetical protein LPJ61_005497 [Coemansia biformis]|uniref:Mitochondrial outer membrane transport complex Sam37/metaxin N-terminal domain-containing protein n=1 Tax=Coemansia biformis TaxID=1286918 RepID=A0A9W8CW90_9FUNG|nr:hypothetical protein LPJ61_005497 [Coemansia biformis]